MRSKASLRIKYDVFEVLQDTNKDANDCNSSTTIGSGRQFTSDSTMDSDAAEASGGDHPSMHGKILMREMLENHNPTIYYEIDAYIDENKSRISKYLRSKNIRMQECMSPHLSHIINYKSMTTLTTTSLLLKCFRLFSRVRGELLLANCQDQLKQLEGFL